MYIFKHFKLLSSTFIELTPYTLWRFKLIKFLYLGMNLLVVSNVSI